MIVLSKLVNYFEIFYETFFKSSVLFIFKFYYGNSKRFRLNCIDDVILTKSATQLTKLIRDREITSETVVRVYIKRIKEIQPILNCVVDERFENALQEAREIDKLIAANKINNNLPLLGIPYTCSESILVKGMKNSVGLVCRKYVKAEEDADVIKLMRNAGAILLCTTNVGELGLWVETANRVYGKTRNPYDTRRIVGGSAGGEGCIISSCGSLIGLSTDLTGGLRLAASFNGIFAHKPTNGIISKNGYYPDSLTSNQNRMLSIGPLCRYSKDLNILLEILSSDVNNNMNNRLVPFDDTFDLKELKFYFIDLIDAPFVSKLSNDVKLALTNLINFFEIHSGNQVKRLNSKYLSKSFNIWISMITENNDPYQLNKLLTDNKTTENLFLELLYSLIGISNHTFPIISLSCTELIYSIVNNNEISQYNNIIEQLKDELDAILSTNGIIIIPTFPTVAPFHNQTLLTNPIDSIAYCGLFNALGFPSTQIPLGLNSDKLPIGIQLISNRYCDRLTIKLANLIEYVLGGWVEP